MEATCAGFDRGGLLTERRLNVGFTRVCSELGPTGVVGTEVAGPSCLHPRGDVADPKEEKISANQGKKGTKNKHHDRC